MFTVKEQMTEIIYNQPEDSSFEEILKELAFQQMINQGLNDSRDNNVSSNEEVKEMIDKW